MQIMRINDRFYLGPQPTGADLDSLARDGVRTVIDFRHPSETRTPNEDLVRQHGMQYVNIPIQQNTISDADIDRLREAVATKPAGFLLHCGVGSRAGAMYLMMTAVDLGWTPERAFEEAARMGFNCDSLPQLKKFFADYIQRHYRARETRPSDSRTTTPPPG